MTSQLTILAVLAVFAISSTFAAHDHHGGGDHHHGGGGGSDHHHHHDHHGSDGHHHHHHHHSHSTDNWLSGGGIGSSGSSGSSGPGLLSLLFGWNRPRYNYNNYHRGYCRVSQFVDYVGRTPRYYCDCPPYPPNYQWNYCTPMNAYGRK